MKYLIDKSTVINSDHIVKAVYDEASSGIDDETGKPFNNRSKCTITLDSVHVEVHTVYDGDVDGAASESDEIVLQGGLADRFWEAYSSDTYAL